LVAFAWQQWLGERAILFGVRTFPLVRNEEACIDFDAVKTGNVACTLSWYSGCRSHLSCG